MHASTTFSSISLGCFLSLAGCDFQLFSSSDDPEGGGDAAGANLAVCAKKPHERNIENKDEARATELICSDRQYGSHVQIGMGLEKEHATFDDRKFDHLHAGLMVLTCSKLCDQSDPMAVGMLEWFARKVEPEKMEASMSGWAMDARTRSIFKEQVAAAAQDIRQRASELDPRRQHMYVEVPNRVRDLREAYFKEHAGLYGKIDALEAEITSAKGGQADAAAVADKLTAIREEYLAGCKSPDCRFDPLVIEVTRELVLLNVAKKDDLAALAEWDLFRDQAPYRNSYAASVHMALYLAMKQETENNSAYEKMKGAGADEATLKARFGDPPPIKVSPGGAWKGSKSPPNLVAGLDRRQYKSVGGVVKKVKKDKDGLMKVSFEDRVSSYTLTDCVDTNKVEAIEPGTGRIIYRQRCKTVGKKTTRDKTDPILIPAAEGKKIKRKEEITALVAPDTRTGHLLRARNKNGDLVQLRSHRLDPKVERPTLFQVLPEEG